MYKILIAVFVIFLTFQYFNGHDSNFIPYSLTGIDAFVYNDIDDQEFPAGKIKVNYFQRERALKECAKYAISKADSLNLNNWSYLCYTKTHKPGYQTKVR